MNLVISKTFGGLSKPYYIRHFLFGLIFPAIFYFMFSEAKNGVPIQIILLCVVNSLLYPYSRFVYEKITSFILGDNVFFVNAILMLIMKYFAMAICWSAAILIAPFGLAYLYFYHSASEH